MISATGGVFILIKWPNGPAGHFMLSEIFTPGVPGTLFRIYANLYGVPTLHPPTLAFPSNRIH